VDRHLTHRFWGCLLIGISGPMLALLWGLLAPLAFTAPFLAALAVSIIDGWWPVVRVEHPTVSAPRIVEGDQLVFAIDLVAPSPTWTDLEVQFPAGLVPTAPARLVAIIGDRRRFTIPLSAKRWGAAGPEWAVVTTRDRLGISELVVRYPLNLPVRIHPPAERLTNLVPLRRERTVSGEHRARAKGPGTELAEVRPYRAGDPVRMVHPHLSGRRGQPMVVERHPDRSSDVVLLVDSSQDLGVDLDTTLRWTVTAAMALTERHLRAQDRVGLVDLGHGVRWLPAKLGRRHLHTIVDSLLATEVLSRRPSDIGAGLPVVSDFRLPPSATLVAISPLLATRTLSTLVTLRSRGHEILIVKPSIPPPEAYISNLARRVFAVGNETNERWLQERGVVIIPWSTGDSLEHVMRRVSQNLGRTRQPART
jgi:uncharacterized protein (DUF58 family)